MYNSTVRTRRKERKENKTSICLLTALFILPPFFLATKISKAQLLQLPTQQLSVIVKMSSNTTAHYFGFPKIANDLHSR